MTVTQRGNGLAMQLMEGTVFSEVGIDLLDITEDTKYSYRQSSVWGRSSLDHRRTVSLSDRVSRSIARLSLVGIGGEHAGTRRKTRR